MSNIIIEVLNSGSNPFVENTKSWQQWVDILTAYNSKTNLVSLLELCMVHDMSPNYYKDLTPLVDSGLIKVYKVSND